MEAAGATATALPLTSHPSDQHSLPLHFVSPLAKPTENSIGMTGLDFAFSIPAQQGLPDMWSISAPIVAKPKPIAPSINSNNLTRITLGILPFLSHTGVTRRSTALFLRRLPRTTSPIYAPLYGNKKWDAVPATHNRPARSLPRIQLAERCHF